jgi:hypothetical protein
MATVIHLHTLLRVVFACVDPLDMATVIHLHTLLRVVVWTP